MKPIFTDIDIDLIDRDAMLTGLEFVTASIARDNGKVEKHNTGVYFQNIPRDPLTNLANLDYKVAGNYGYFKVDFLNVSMYEGIRDEKHLMDLINREPQWELFTYKEITDQLFHLNGHSDLLQKFKPTSVDDLSVILAIIRPSKAHLRNKSWKEICKEVWVKDTMNNNYYFKRSHSISYAVAIVVHLNLLVEQLNENS